MNKQDLHSIVVVGGGLAAASAVAALRDEGYDGRVVLVGQEPHLPYERPPLSKGYLMGEATFSDAFAHPAEFYDTHDIDLRLATTVTALDLDAHTVVAGHETIGYDKLLLATGSSARRLPPADRSGAAVAYLRTVEDSDRIRAALAQKRRIVVIGGGWIGLEVAAAARTHGCDVVVVEPLAEPLLRVLGPTVGNAFAGLHRRHGVDLRTSTGVAAITTRPGPQGRRDGGGPALVELDDGTAVEADLVVVGIGASPNTELAEAAGLKVDDGVVADERLATSHPDVYVAGDIARVHHPLLKRSLRVEHWDNALKQGATAARNMLGAGEAYERMPYFFTDQYELGMEYVGHTGPEGYDDLVVRGDLDGTYTAFWLQQGQVVAAMHANDWDTTGDLRRIVEGSSVDLASLRDSSVPLADVDAGPRLSYGE